MAHPIAKIIAQPWAIMESLYDAGVEYYRRRISGEEINQMVHVEVHTSKVDAIEDAVKVASKPYAMVGDVAIIPIEGVMTKRPMSMGLCEPMTKGMASIMDDFTEAVNDPEVGSIVLYMDTPGGTVDGTQALADRIYASRGKKPITAYVDGMAASAGMWVASQADRIIASSATDVIGSIGVVSTHIDQSEAEKQMGIKVTEVTAGKYKRIHSSHKPLDKEGRSAMQDRVDAVYGEFLDAVARGRGESSEIVDEIWAQGREFIAKEAVSLGLIDSIQSFPEMISGMVKKDRDKSKEKKPHVIQETKMTEAEQERQRIQAIMEAAPKGMEQLANKLAFVDNATLAQAESAFLAQARKQLEEGSLTPVGADNRGGDPLRNRWAESEMVRNLFGSFEEYQQSQAAFQAAHAQGRIKLKTKEN